MEDDNNTASKLIEIKEILDNPKILMLSYGNYISLNDYVKLKDYITNLQQENEKLKEDLIGQENLAMAFSKTSHDYYQRIEKAVEYMNNTFNITSVKDMFDIMNKLEDILNDL